VSLSALIAEILKAAYVESGRTQGDVGAAAGISQSQVSKLLRGVRVPDVDELEALCDALDLDVVEVVREAVQKRR
jgi:transcriptional regulator with XRE-family HTH domain